MATGFANREAAGRELAQRLMHLRQQSGTPVGPSHAPSGGSAQPAQGSEGIGGSAAPGVGGSAAPGVGGSAAPGGGSGTAGRSGSGVVVLGLPRGGVPVAAEVARALGVPLDVIVVRKLGLPWQPELAMGAVGEDGAMVLNADIARSVSKADLDHVVARERAELQRRVALWRGGRERVPLGGRTVVIVDDGVATGATAAAACAVARHAGAARVVLATPVAPPDVVEKLRWQADEVIVVLTPSPFRAVGQWYDDFTPTPDEAVTRLLGA